ncbi:low molecular weight phosphotyrosine protein phosphatase [Verrucomicrobiaceae bacterium 5K15]|uniref:protein-tyrosine-phosphatase n=1 Tax=Oceaniferula flava TaxID=2800421 RepID=A0AAE2VB56_9BACT|nr:low molecular weight protein-tyrosine-phosphatase [Oceaniferula flavus]MBK1854160.1 low molecular weight phosphotyrosine protein phosphatase [Oceaniferula flavus]MBM1135466.1 low molecular weight phosphotyrosine protein phosphatase [Oceaniferula flavus]
MPRTPFNVLFVCLGNICRSPAGENIFRHQVKEAGLADAIRIDSAGTANYHTGKGPDRRMCATLRARGVPSDGSARQFTVCDFQKFDLILTMDEENYSNVSSLAPDAETLTKVKMFTSFCTVEANRIPDVPDPYYGGAEGFEQVADMLEDGCAEIIRRYQDGELDR